MKSSLAAVACLGQLLLCVVPAWSAGIPPQETPGLRIAAGSGEPAPQGTGVVAYYFHVNARCQTCLLIERRSGEVINSVFSEEIRKGVLTWNVVNTQQPGNRRLITELRLPSRGLVLVAYRDGNPGRWKTLEGVWQHVHGDPAGFQQYVSREIREFIDLKP